MTESLRALVVDDDAGVRFFLAETLQRTGHAVTTAASGEEALECLRETPYDLLLIDLMLGGQIDGLRVLEAVRWRWPEAVAIILTGYGSLESAMTAIRSGVDGYLLKPVKAEELRDAVNTAVYRQRKSNKDIQQEQQEAILKHGPFTADLNKHTLSKEGQIIDLTPREINLLVYLMQNSHRVVPPTELVQVVRQYQCEDVYEARQIIKWYIHRLRRKIDPTPASDQHIMSVRGIGYRFKEA
jgi:DNA-binding response OmpR family regulator